MAIALQDGIFVWQKVAKALAGATPGVTQPFRELKTFFATQVGNPQLQFIPFTAEQITASLGYSPDIDASRVICLYAKGRRVSGTTASFLAVHAAVDNSSPTTAVFASRFNATGQVVAAIYPGGFPPAAFGQPVETETTISAATTIGGATESAAADAADGFIVVAGGV